METGGSHFDALKNRYKRVTDEMSRLGVRVEDMRQDGNKLHLRAVAPSDQAKNQVWDLIKQTNPGWQNDLAAEIRVEAHGGVAAPVNLGPGSTPAASAGGQQYTVQKGDTLSKIAKQFYGEASKYNQIFQANRNILKDPDEIQAGQVLVIPAEK